MSELLPERSGVADADPQGTTPARAADRPVVPPSMRLLVREPLAVAEFAAFLAASPLLRLVGRGDRRPVLVVPGFISSDRATTPLRWFLRGQGYWVHGWELGWNIGPRQRIVDGIATRLAAVHERHHRPVTVIGWSLGGIYAREIARANPAAVRQVITMGTPFRFGPHDRGNLSGLFGRLNRSTALYPGWEVPEDERPPLEVPVTAIYSRSDGIVRWHACVQSAGPQRENIEVLGSHSGLGYNPAALFAIADRLAQPDGSWKPFRPPPGTGVFFPRPAEWDRARRQVIVDAISGPPERQPERRLSTTALEA
jgi:pimeloyl-ACP methyl ester carboxylesterase